MRVDVFAKWSNFYTITTTITNCYRKISEISFVQAKLQQGMVVVELGWLQPISGPQPPSPIRHKNLEGILHTSRVIANFVSDFVALSTRVGQG